MTSSYQISIRKSILDFYKNNGIKKAEVFCYKLLESEIHKNNKDFRAKIHGEVCESFLECYLDYYITKHKLNDSWFYTKGMVVKDLDSENHHLTELDLTLFTHARIVLFECKSYAGDNTVINECTLQRKNGSKFDVYKQQQNHLSTLRTNVRSCYRGLGNGGFTIALFDLSLGNTIDKRELKWKTEMPLLNSKNLDKFLDKYRCGGCTWDIQRLRKIINIIMGNNKKMREKHLKYVKSIR